MIFLNRHREGGDISALPMSQRDIMMNNCYTLPDHVELRKRDDCCFVLDRNRASVLPLHPSEAFVLSLLDGETGYKELTFLVSKTYRISEIKAQFLIDSVFRKANRYLSSEQKAGVRRYNPKTFIFRCSHENPGYDQPLETPLVLNIALTRRCNFRCRYCYLDFDLQPARDLRKDVALELIQEAGDMGVAVIGLSGGEPLLYHNICEIVSAIIERGMVPLISTNGSLLDSRMVDNLLNAGLQAIQVSLDAPTAENHHFLTQTKNTFELVLSGIRMLKSHGIWVRVKSVITPYNCSLVAGLIDLLVSMGVDEINIALESAHSCESKSTNSFHRLSTTEIAVVRRTVEKKTREYNKCPIIFTDIEKEWQGPQDIIRCGNLFSSLVVHPTGNVSVCEMIENAPELSYGNIYESSIKKIWLNSAHRQLLNLTMSPSRIDKSCSMCQHLAYCRTGCFNLSKLSKGNFFSKDPRCPGPVKMNLS